jgi:hypothetical protein
VVEVAVKGLGVLYSEQGPDTCSKTFDDISGKCFTPGRNLTRVGSLKVVMGPNAACVLGPITIGEAICAQRT